MAESAQDLAVEFDVDGHRAKSGDTFNEIHQKLDFYRRTHYDQYVPAIGPDYADYETRLFRWLQNSGLTDDQKRTLFELAPRIVFLNREDFIKLHQAAFDGPITRWIIDQLGLSFDDPDIDSCVSQEIHCHTWFTGISDSFQVADFHHANNVGGIDFRPDWLSLAEFGDTKKIDEFMRNRCDVNGPRPVHRIVILEDFVGSGTQMIMGKGSVDFAASSFPNTPILFVPLIICPEGAKQARRMVARHSSNLTYEAVLEFTPRDFIVPRADPASDKFEDDIHDVAVSTYAAVCGSGAPPRGRPYEPLGFAKTGAIVVLYSNTPANSLPLIHHQSDQWNALFPRSARVR